MSLKLAGARASLRSFRTLCCIPQLANIDCLLSAGSSWRQMEGWKDGRMESRNSIVLAAFWLQTSPKFAMMIRHRYTRKSKIQHHPHQPPRDVRKAEFEKGH